MAKITALIAKLEALDGPSREVDALICIALNWAGPHQAGTIENLRVSEWCDDFSELDYECRDDGGSIPECTYRTPELTASIDAAVALVERCLPGASWQLHWRGLGKNCDGWIERVEGENDDITHKYEWRGSVCPSPAIALCLALLRAMEGDKP